MNLKGRERNREMVNALFNKKAIKSGVPGYPDDYIPNKIYYIVVNGSKEYFMNENKARSVAYDLKFESPNVSGPYEETDPEEIAEVIDAGIIRSSHRPIKSDLNVEDEAAYWDGLEDAACGLSPADEDDPSYMKGYRNGKKRSGRKSYADKIYDELESSRKPIKSSKYYTSYGHWKLNTAVVPVSKKMVMSFFEDGTWDWNDTVGIYGRLENSNSGRVTPAVIFGSSGTYKKLEKGGGLFNDQSWNDIGYFEFTDYLYDDEVFEIPNCRYFVLK